ncbi:hypothetical protein [Streptomyces goshikiensis]|uniref:hypothetical protein n=1 Tax=Streptomyces goshikiensis TaxID=1942 RepID=UPI0036BEE11C
MELAHYGELFTTDRYHPGLRPFPGQPTSKSRGTKANRTPPVSDKVFQPILAAALHLVQTLAPPLLRELDANRRFDARRAVLSKTRMYLAELEEVIRRHVAEKRPFDRNADWAKPRKWISKDDPLAKVNLCSLAAETSSMSRTCGSTEGRTSPRPAYGRSPAW